MWRCRSLLRRSVCSESPKLLEPDACSLPSALADQFQRAALLHRSMGDALAQRVEKGPFDARRNLLTAGYGALAVGPFGHAW